MALTRLLRWLLFTVALALVPFAYFVVRGVTSGDPATPADVLGGGDLYLVAAAVCAAGIGELAAARTSRPPPVHVATLGFALLVVVFAALLFADTAAARNHASGTSAPPLHDPDAVVTVSAWVLATAMVAGGACVGLAEE